MTACLSICCQIKTKFQPSWERIIKSRMSTMNFFSSTLALQLIFILVKHSWDWQSGLLFQPVWDATQLASSVRLDHNGKYKAGWRWGDLGDFIVFIAEGWTNEGRKWWWNNFILSKVRLKTLVLLSCWNKGAHADIDKNISFICFHARGMGLDRHRITFNKFKEFTIHKFDYRIVRNASCLFDRVMGLTCWWVM